MSNKYLTALAALAATTAFAQSDAPNRISIATADTAAARTATGRGTHARRSTSPAARAMGSDAFTVRSSSRASASGSSGGESTSLRGEGDLTFNGGPVVPYAQSHLIYMNPVTNTCAIVANCWGDPEGFLKDLGDSDFIHITDQYVKASADHRYTLGRSFTVNYNQNPSDFRFFDADILAVIHTAAASTGQTGYGHIYHVLLPPFQDVCAAGIGCASTTICAYHSSADFPDIGHVIYSVEPYQSSFGCAIAGPSPNGVVADSLYNVLSHELFEIITNPDDGAWTNTSQLSLLGQEIGDVCEFINSSFLFDVPTFKIGKKLYAVQREHDNAQHGCATKPN